MSTPPATPPRSRARTACAPPSARRSSSKAACGVSSSPGRRATKRSRRTRRSALPDSASSWQRPSRTRPPVPSSSGLARASSPPETKRGVESSATFMTEHNSNWSHLQSGCSRRKSACLPVEIDLRCDRRVPDGIEVAAYYVASEALTNAAKHAEASRVRIALHLDEATLYLSIRDDGLGGADASRGSGLIGVRDRVEALGGTIDLASPPGSGTRLDVELPLLAAPSVASKSEPLSRV